MLFRSIGISPSATSRCSLYPIQLVVWPLALRLVPTAQCFGKSASIAAILILAWRTAGYILAEEVRYNERSAAERINGGLKDDFGGRYVRVRGHAKVLCHLMFGILAPTLNHLMRLVTWLTQPLPPRQSDSPARPQHAFKLAKKLPIRQK